ncbi:probable enoyl-CoA hydratase 2, mitochondrial [Tanacetum coccineum]
MDRPEAKNALGKDMLRGLLNSFETISADSTANVLMICSSVPRVFCAGADLKEREAMNVSEVRASVNSMVIIFSHRVTTIAVIEGATLGVDRKWLYLAIFGYVVMLREDAKLALPETGLAIIPGAGGTQRLPRLVGKSIAKELIFTGRKIRAKDALSIGLVNYCVPAGEAYSKALEVAREINQKGPVAIRMAKRAINEGLEVSMASALGVEEDCYEQTLHTNDRLEGLSAFAEKRKPLSLQLWRLDVSYVTGKHPIGADQVDLARDAIFETVDEVKNKVEQLGNDITKDIAKISSGSDGDKEGEKS